MRIGLLLFALTNLMIGCDPVDVATVQSKYGTGRNELRKELGVPLVGPEWSVEKIGEEYRFTNPVASSPRGEPVHAIKAVFTDHGGRVVREVDTFRGAKSDTFRDWEGSDIRKKLSHEFNFLEEDATKRRSIRGDVGEGISQRLTVDQANRLLSQWGLAGIPSGHKHDGEEKGGR